MTDLSKNLLDAARAGLAPDAAAMARVRAKVAATVTPAAPTATATAKSTLGATLAKLSVLVLVAGAVSVVVVTHRATATATAPSIGVGAPHEDEPRIEAAPRASAEAPPPAAAIEHRAVSVPAVVTLAREVELIDHAMELLKARDYRAALAAIETFQRETRGHGQMAEDAAAIDIEARCGLHESVSARLAQFDAVWPTSAQRSRLQSLCFGR